MAKIILICTLFIIQNLFSQNFTIKGEVRDSKTKAVLSYVNIGIPNENVGTVSNQEGQFNLKLNDSINLKKEIYFSYIGYKTKTIKIGELKKDHQNIVALESDMNQLKEVVVSLKKPKQKKIGRASKGLGLMHMNFYTYSEKDVDDRRSKEVGMKMKIKKDCRIDDLNFNVTSNDFKSLKFRLNFYAIKDNLPSDLLLSKDIIFEIKDGFLGWFKVDLKPYDIYIDKENEEFAVTIQWLESKKIEEKSKYFAISIAKSPTSTFYYREKGMDSWTKSNSSLSFYLNGMCD